ncbi:MAG: NUDIX hydrolase [Anaerolineae bacterium]|nr:NUDIX hydrolase [Anaerolineae bacterium]
MGQTKPTVSSPDRDKGNKPYAVRALLVREQEILLIHHAFADPAMFGKWTFPGGRLDPDETDPLAALHREMAEELSVEVEVLGELGVYYSRSGWDYTIFAVRPLGEIGPLQMEEIREVAWLTPAEIYEWYRKDKLQFGFEMEAVSAYVKQFL